MKIRNGFVSNSSSSSFIISHPKGVELTKQSLHQAIFGSDVEQNFAPRYHDEFGLITSTQVVDHVFDLLQQNHPYRYSGLVAKDNIEEICGGREPDGIKTPDSYGNTDFTTPDGKPDWEALDKIRKKAYAIEMARMFMKTQSHDLYMVEISDDTAWGSELEHGDPLNDSPNVTRYSNH